MTDVKKSHEMITDFITGEIVPDIGAEANRQDVERFLVNEKGFSKEDIKVDVDIELNIAGKPYKQNLKTFGTRLIVGILIKIIT